MDLINYAFIIIPFFCSLGLNTYPWLMNGADRKKMKRVYCSGKSLNLESSSYIGFNQVTCAFGRANARERAVLARSEVDLTMSWILTES